MSEQPHWLVWINLRFALPMMQSLKFLCLRLPLKLFWQCSSPLWVMSACAAIFFPLKTVSPRVCTFYSLYADKCEKSTSHMNWWKFLPSVLTLGVESTSATAGTHSLCCLVSDTAATMPVLCVHLFMGFSLGIPSILCGMSMTLLSQPVIFYWHICTVAGENH